MSLNWKEIDQVLCELDLEKAFLQKIRQPDFETLVLDLYKPGKNASLLINLQGKDVGLHLSTSTFLSSSKNQRFVQLLRSRLQGCKLVSYRQIKKQRIVQFEFANSEEQFFLFAKLWAHSANVIFTDSNFRIIDAQFRRPKKSEVKDSIYPPENLEETLPDREFPVRDFSHYKNLNDFLDQCYKDESILDNKEKKRELALKAWNEIWVRTMTSFSARESRMEKLDLLSKDRTMGDMLLSIGKQKAVDDLFIGYSFEPPYDEIRIPVLKSTSSIEAANEYYERARKSEKEKAQINSELEVLQNRITRLEKIKPLIDEYDSEAMAFVLRLKTTSKNPKNKTTGTGVKVQIGEFTILIGRNARENDVLLRKQVKGQDMWMHVRDWPGGYVFIKSRKNKSIPLNILIDAAQLAVHFSKARTGGKIDLYYTKVKFLRRTKNGPKGLVIPTSEKNFTVDYDPQTARSLLAENSEIDA